MGMASLSKRITQKGGFRMRGRNVVILVGLLALLSVMAGVPTRAQATGDPEADFSFSGSLLQPILVTLLTLRPLT
jgi:hypothetical protein